MRFLLPIFLCLALSACGWGVHKVDIQQGNVVTKDVLDKVKPGMTKAEVRNSLGTPLLTDVFHANRWDYYFSNAKRGREIERYKVTLVFENDKLKDIIGAAPVAVAGEGGQQQETRP